MNLHAAVRSIIPAVNPDIDATYRQSTGYTTAADGSRTPTYSDSTVRAQVQALSAGQLRHADQLNIQGVLRTVYVYGNPLGVERPTMRGGDLMLFPQVLGGPTLTWLVYTVNETWAPDAAGWGCVGVVLQE